MQETSERDRWTTQGRRVRMARSGTDMNQTELARAVSDVWTRAISRDFIRRIEIGERDAEMGVLWAIAQITDQPLFWLTGIDDPSVLDSVNPGELKRFAVNLLLDPRHRVLAGSNLSAVAA